METAPLKSFATWARTALIREVSARISVVLASEELRQEQPNAVAALEKAVDAAGGSDKGRDTVADKVAYTWFNRIIALRFMDAKAYTGIGVVSPERGREGGQPEVLAEAKRGNIDSTVVTNKRTAETVTSLLNGMRRSDDPQGEAYALLLAEYCRHWNRSMPFMFEREGDYTELLIPTNLLADDSVLARAASVLTEDVCQDVEVIGWLYQFYISERKAEVFAGFKKNKRAGAAEIPAATQLFTPHWIVRYLVENSLGRLWLLNRPTSRLSDQMEYYIAPVDVETDYLKVSSPEELKIIDPACGSGHMLTYAFDLLHAIYEEEGYAPSDIPGLILAKNLFGTEIDPRAGALAAFALTMKARSRQRTFFNKKVQPNICVLEPLSFTPTELSTLVTRGGSRHDEETFWNQFQYADTFGSLIQPRQERIEPLRQHLEANQADETDLFGGQLFERARRVLMQAEYLSTRYHVVIANPPYMGSGNMGPRLAEFAKREFPDSKSDLFAMFIERNLGLTVLGGDVAMITMQSWMFLSSYALLRRRVLRESAITCMAHLGTRAFDTIGGDVVGATAFILCAASRPDLQGTYLRLVDGRSEREKSRLFVEAVENPTVGHRFHRSGMVFHAIPGSPIAYWVSDALFAAFVKGRPLSDIAKAAVGLQTGENGRFVRGWYEVSMHRVGLRMGSRADAKLSGRKWFPYNKGGGFRRWYGNQEFVVDWSQDGREIRHFSDSSGKVRSRAQNTEYYMRPSVSWSKVSSGIPGFRYFPEGFVFDVAGTSIFADTHKTRMTLLALMNSTVMLDMLAVIAPTLNFEVGTIASLPVIESSDSSTAELVDELVQLSKDDWDASEMSWDFKRPPFVDLEAGGRLFQDALLNYRADGRRAVARMQTLEESSNRRIIEMYGLSEEVDPAVSHDRISLNVNPEYRYGTGRSPSELEILENLDAVRDLLSYAVGCMFGRYSLDEPGLILANQGDTLQDYLARIPSPKFYPDKDNVIPVVDGDWFEDDIVARFRQFLRVAFGEAHFEENLRFVTDALGVKDLRDYFVKSFYKDHVQRYKKRPIYWMFSSPKGSFNALIYMHRYTPSTASTVLNEYLREFKAKLDASRQHHERLAAGTGAPRQQAAAQKEVDRLRKVLLELDEYEHDVLYPLASQQVQIDLDDGVKANYPKLGAALKKIPGLEASDE